MELDLDPLITELPFIMQMKIMEYRPRLFKLSEKVLQVMEKHLNTRYCNICGEYIDCIRYRNRKPPFHVHPSNKNLYARYTPKKKQYQYINPTIEDLFLHERPLHTVSTLKYTLHSSYQYDQLPVRFKYRVHGPRYFFNFTRLINYRSRVMILSNDPRHKNVFENPEVYVVDTYDDNIYVDSPDDNDDVDVPCRGGPCHLEKIAIIFRQILNVYPYIWNHLINRKEVYQCVPLLLVMVERAPMNVIHRLIYRNFVNMHKEEADNLLLIVLKHNYRLLEYITERKLGQLFRKNRDFFFTLQEKYPEVKDYFYFQDSLEITKSARISLFYKKKKSSINIRGGVSSLS
jgi:hypothetical protein